MPLPTTFPTRTTTAGDGPGNRPRHDRYGVAGGRRGAGRGVDYHALLAGNEFDHAALCSGGLTLIRGMCESLRYFGRGNQVEATYRLNGVP